MLPLQARVNPGAMAMKGYSAFSKAPALRGPHHQIVSCHKRETRWVRVFYSTAEVQSVRSTAPRCGGGADIFHPWPFLYLYNLQ